MKKTCAQSQIDRASMRRPTDQTQRTLFPHHPHQQNRPIVGACAGVLWNVYMSSVINAKQHHEHEQQELVAPLEEAAAVSQPPLRQPQAQPLLAAVVEPATATAATAVAAAPPPQQQAEEGARVGSVGEKDGPAAAAVGGIWERWAPAGALAFPASINIRFF